MLAFSDEDTVMAGGDVVWLKNCPGTKHKGVKHLTIKGVGHFLQDGGADQLVIAINNFIKSTPPEEINSLSIKSNLNEDEFLAKSEAETKAAKKALTHGDKGISTPTDGGLSFIAPTPDGRDPYQ